MSSTVPFKAVLLDTASLERNLQAAVGRDKFVNTNVFLNAANKCWAETTGLKSEHIILVETRPKG